MIFIKKLDRRPSKNGKFLIQWALFFCGYCERYVEKDISYKKFKSCGCSMYKLSSASLKGKKKSEEQNKKVSIAKKKYWSYLSKEERKFTKMHKNNISKALKGKNKTEKHKQKLKENHADVSGANNPNWQGGKSFEPYSPEFNKELKKSILERDNYKCQKESCLKKSNTLGIHHIDYNKKNNKNENLITLCNSCNIKANYNRNSWQEYYSNIIDVNVKKIYK